MGSQLLFVAVAVAVVAVADVDRCRQVAGERLGLARTWDRVVIDERRLTGPDEPLEDLAATNRATA